MKILVFGAHPDDYEIGMGGTINKLVNLGHEIKLVLVTVPNSREIRIKEANEAAQILGAEMFFLDIPTDKISFSRYLISKFDLLIKNFRPDEIYTHWVHDSHQDHQAISNSVISSTRKNKASLFMYSQTVPGGIVPQSFTDQIFVDISDTIEVKIASILAHKSQIESNGMDWVNGVKGRAKLHGYQINVDYAETFYVVKHLRNFHKNIV